ncbi:hypothetical protein M1105_16485 [Limibaculum sp. FT325]|uniref:hypothetical protein n=1 Tax=Thermohalobaculum sediminis TaxID=2939436 RepID=UPI0020C141BC|nr:hypothetical protein [Limibaculum sediminis]MCL5778577.1 hypothetical protein [Limibaculum sediminis]
MIRLEFEILRIGDEVFEPPANIFDLPEYFATAQRRDVSLIKAGRAVLAARGRDPERGEVRRRNLEEHYLRLDQPVHYRMVIVKFDPLVRFKTGQVFDRVEVSTHLVEPRQ